MKLLLRWTVSLALLALLLLLFDPTRVWAQARSLDPGFLLAGLLLVQGQIILSAWRWRFTARRLGLKLKPGRALADYYLASFVNQTLPGGMLGDAWRAERHARDSRRRGPAWRAVILERVSGQIVSLPFSLAALMAVPSWREGLARAVPAPGLAAGLLILILLVAWLAGWAARRWPEAWRRFLDDAHRALFAAGAWPLQLISSTLIVLSYALVFALAARGLGVEIELSTLMLVAFPVLLSMLIPLSVAGWGWREAAAAALWLSLGLPAEQGLAVSMAYGVVVAVGALPGAAVLLHDRSRSTTSSSASR